MGSSATMSIEAQALIPQDASSSKCDSILHSLNITPVLEIQTHRSIWLSMLMQNGPCLVIINALISYKLLCLLG